MKDLWLTLCTEWQQNPSCIMFETVGTVASMTAAVLLSFALTGLIPVYVCWLVGSLCLTASSWQRKNINLLLLMQFYTIMNLIGLWNYL